MEAAKGLEVGEIPEEIVNKFCEAGEVFPATKEEIEEAYKINYMGKGYEEEEIHPISIETYNEIKDKIDWGDNWLL